MKFWSFTIALLLCFFSMEGRINQNNDFQVWFSEIAKIPFNETYTGYLFNEQRIGDGGSDFYQYYVQAQLDIQLNKTFSIDPSYRHTWNNDNERREWREIAQLFVDLFIYKKEKKTTYMSRNRLSYIMPEQEKNRWEYRHLLQVNLPWFIGRSQIYVGDEIFIRETRGLFQNRSIVGLLMPLSEKLTGQLYFMLRMQEREKVWIQNHILGIMLTVLF